MSSTTKIHDSTRKRDLRKRKYHKKNLAYQIVKHSSHLRILTVYGNLRDISFFMSKMKLVLQEPPSNRTC